MNKTNTKIWERRQLSAVFIIVTLVVLLTSVVKYRSGEIDYHNSDATWHTLLTIEAYHQTPISKHLFLPIVSLGRADDKGIPWGATIPDKDGNYYYTSFSPAGYFLPWLFMKIFRLPIRESSLYLFNTLLFVLSAWILIWLLAIVYKGNRHRTLLCFIGGMAYSFAPELLHGMGIVYWHQSILQVTLLLQIVAYYQYALQDNKRYRWLFYLLALINPYIEWTGYVANVGFALAELLVHWKLDRKKGFRKAVLLGMITVVSGSMFVAHYLLRVDKLAFLAVMKGRFMTRNITAPVMLTDLFAGYLKSFLYLWVLFIVLLVWCFIKKQRLEMNKGILIFVMVFPILENVIMKQHALQYTYDRMKAVYLLVFLICEVTRNILHNERRKNVSVALIVLTVACSALNLYSYVKDTSYIWTVTERENNQKLADFVTERYPDALYASNAVVRGYMNLLFQKGIYENVEIERAKELAKERGKTQIVYITRGGDPIQDIKVYDTSGSNWISCYIKNGEVVTEILDKGYRLANWTDQNWTNGYSNTDHILLFYAEKKLLADLLSHSKICVDNQRYTIINVNYDETWIRVTVDRNAAACMYPATINLE